MLEDPGEGQGREALRFALAIGCVIAAAFHVGIKICGDRLPTQIDVGHHPAELPAPIKGYIVDEFQIDPHLRSHSHGETVADLVVVQRNGTTGKLTILPIQSVNLAENTLVVQIASFGTFQAATTTGVDLGASTAFVNPTSLRADGSSAAEVTVTVRDPAGQPIPNRGVFLTMSGGGNTIVQPSSTDANQAATDSS